MAETRNGRAERREEIKLRLEYLKLAISLGVIGTLLFAGLQWRMGNQAALQTDYQRIVSEWRTISRHLWRSRYCVHISK